MKPEITLDELQKYIQNYSNILSQIKKINETNKINVKRPGVSPVFSEQLCLLKHKELFPDSTGATKGGSTHPDLIVFFGKKKVNVEIKCTISDFEDIRQDTKCDFLVWIDIKEINKSLIRAYILDNSNGALRKFIKDKKVRGSKNATRIQLNEFKKLNPIIKEIEF